MAQTIRLLLRRPQLALSLQDGHELADLQLPGAEFLRELIALIRQHPDINTARILEQWRGTKYEQRLSELAPVPQSGYVDEDVFDSPGYLEAEFQGAVAKLRDSARKQHLGELGQITSPKQLSDEQKRHLRNLNPSARPVREN